MIIKAHKYDGSWKISSMGKSGVWYNWQWRFTTRKNALIIGIALLLDTPGGV